MMKVSKNSAEFSNIRIKILQSIKSDLKQQWKCSQNDIAAIDERFNKISREYNHLLRKFVVRNDPKILQMMANAKGKRSLNMREAVVINSQLQNGDQFKLTILNDLLFKLNLQRIFIRWKCQTYIGYLRWKLIKHKLTRRCNISNKKSIFNAWNDISSKSKQKVIKSEEFQNKQYHKTLAKSFGIWMNQTRKIMQSQVRATQFIEQQNVK